MLGFIGGGGCGWLQQPPKPDPNGYRQLTRDGGESGSPSLSRDGKFVVYASDRESPDNLEIWVQAVDQGNAVRLTNDPARDYDPVFSADGQTVYFTSLREPQGIYKVPVAGGTAELLLKGAVSPEMSPDGQTLLFSDGTGQLATLRLADHTARPLLKGFFNSYAPKWSPGGKEILFAGKATREEAVEWWITNAAGNAPVNTHLLDSLLGAGFVDAFAQAWLPGDEILFAGKQGERITLWRAKVAPDRQGLASKPVRATNDFQSDFRAAYNAGHLVFERSKGTMNLWSLPVDEAQGRVTGGPERVTSSDAQKGSASLSADGRTLLYSADTGAGFHLVLRDLMNQQERMVGSANLFYGVMSPDGSRYAFGEGLPGAIDVSTRAVRGWRSWWSHGVCERCGMPRTLSRDGKLLLTWTDGDPGNHVDLLDLESGKSRRVLESFEHHFYGPELSPRGDWVSFVANTNSHIFRTYVAHIPAEGSIPESAWIAITPASDDFQMAFWSPDESLLYMLAEHGEGNLNWLDAQRLDAGKRAVGEPLHLYHFKTPRVPQMDPIWNHPAAVAERIVLELVDQSSNVWMMNAPGAVAVQ